VAEQQQQRDEVVAGALH
jgi:hypothetical protein